MSDLTSDPILAFQKKYFIILMPLICFAIPSVIPVYFWGEEIKVSIFVNVFRYLVVVHSAFTINSWAHAFGTKPYDRWVEERDWKLSIITFVSGTSLLVKVFYVQQLPKEKAGTTTTTLFLGIIRPRSWVRTEVAGPLHLLI